MKRSKFSLSHTVLMSCDMGKLIPCGLVEVLPGDTIQQSTSILTRLQPLLAPLMHRVDVRIHHWYVPTRLIWEDFEDFITGGPDGENASAPPTKTVNNGSGWPIGSLQDYLGLPTGVDDLTVSALPFRAYALIWNEWYRDQDLQTPLTVATTSGADSSTNATIQNAAWEKDYFTSARPWPQKGPDVTIPLGVTAPVVSDNTSPQFIDGTGNWGTLGFNAGDVVVAAPNSGTPTGTGGKFRTTNTGLITDLSGATAASVTDLRRAMALQRIMEARSRYGSRYTEYLRYLGVRSSDARLQRPEYLGGGRNTLQISEVLQTSPTTDGDDSEGVGNIKGHAIGAVRSNRYRRFFEEHGYILSLVSIRPKTIYMNGINRMWLRQTKEDWWQKELQHIGQQEVYKGELFARPNTGSTPQPNYETFGYQDRYDEYRRIESRVSGEFRTTLDFWHMARSFGSMPTLNSDFVKCEPTTEIWPSTDTDPCYLMVGHSIQARRLLARNAGGHIF